MNSLIMGLLEQLMIKELFWNFLVKLKGFYLLRI